MNQGNTAATQAVFAGTEFSDVVRLDPDSEEWQARVLDGGKYVRGPVSMTRTRAGETLYWCRSCHPGDKNHKFKIMADGTAVLHTSASASASAFLPAPAATRASGAAAAAAAIICGFE